jgi:hypothetical protein
LEILNGNVANPGVARLAEQILRAAIQQSEGQVKASLKMNVEQNRERAQDKRTGILHVWH